MKRDGELWRFSWLRPVKYLNNIVEQDHRRIKRLVRPGLGFGSLPTARRTLAGYEGMAMIRAFEALPPSATLDDAVDLMLRTSQHDFPVLDGSGRPRGLLTRDGLIVALRQGGPTTPVLDVVTRDLPVAGNREPFDAALARLNQTKAPALLILDESGRLVGLLTPENVGEMMLVRSVRPDWRFRRPRTAAPGTLA